jgi:hypothetical protein
MCRMAMCARLNIHLSTRWSPRSWKVPVGPSGGRFARRTIASVPSVTICVPRRLLSTAWADDLTGLGRGYFFGLNRYLFIASKQAR